MSSRDLKNSRWHLDCVSAEQDLVFVFVCHVMPPQVLVQTYQEELMNVCGIIYDGVMKSQHLTFKQGIGGRLETFKSGTQELLICR